MPCEKENSFLISLSDFDNLQIIGVNFKDRNKNAKSFLNKFGNPEDVANTIAFLSSNLSDYITGETIHVNGGMYFS